MSAKSRPFVVLMYGQHGNSALDHGTTGTVSQTWSGAVRSWLKELKLRELKLKHSQQPEQLQELAEAEEVDRGAEENSQDPAAGIKF